MSKLGKAETKIACRLHDECNGSDVFGSDICTCRPYPRTASRSASRWRRRAASASSSIIARKAARWARCTSSSVYNARKRQPGGDSAAQYFNRTECVAGVQDMRLQELMPDVFHWLGIARIDRFASMSNMKSDALREQGIEIVEQVAIPDELIPADALVEMDAKKAAGYFTSKKPETAGARNELARDEWSEVSTSMKRRESAAMLAYLRTPAAIRERAEAMLKYAEDGQIAAGSRSIANGLEAAVQATLSRDAAALRQSGGDPVPFALAAFRGRRPRSLAARWPSGCPDLPSEEVARRRMDLAVRRRCCSMPVRGRPGRYREPGTGETYARSEGLGVASLHMFANGAFSRDAKGDPLRVDAERLGSADADGHRHGLPGEGAQSADRPRRPRRASAQAGQRRPGAAGRPVRHRRARPR